MNHPKDIGDRTTLAVITGLRTCGYAVMVPFGENTRYDLVIDNGVQLARVQCKTGRLRAGAVLFNACSNYGHHANPRPRRGYDGEIDFFGVHCVETGGVYLIPIEQVKARNQGSLRVAPARNRQRRGVRFASSYEVAKVFVTEAPAGSPGATGSSV